MFPISGRSNMGGNILLTEYNRTTQFYSVVKDSILQQINLFLPTGAPQEEMDRKINAEDRFQVRQSTGNLIHTLTWYPRGSERLLWRRPPWTHTGTITICNEDKLIILLDSPAAILGMIRHKETTWNKTDTCTDLCQQVNQIHTACTSCTSLMHI